MRCGEGCPSSKLSWVTRKGEACAEEISEYADSLGVLLCPLKLAMFAHSVPWPYAALGSRVACPKDACRECDGGEKAPWF